MDRSEDIGEPVVQAPAGGPVSYTKVCQIGQGAYGVVFLVKSNDATGEEVSETQLRTRPRRTHKQLM